MADRRPILILYASAGAGHRSAALAIAQSLRALAPDARVEVHDALSHTNVAFRSLYAQGYLFLANYLPAAMGALYRATDRPDAREFGLRSHLQCLNARPLATWLAGRRPALIINTHFFPAEIVARLRRQRRIECPQFVVTTDFDTHRIWRQSPAERYFTATPDGKAYLERCGADPSAVRCVGIPVRSTFRQPLTQRRARLALGLEERRPLALLLCGGFGVGPTQRLLKALMPLRAIARIVAITGKNERLRRQLQRVTAAARQVHIVGHTTRMALWMHAADVCVTKPGGLTCAEALVCGLPLILVRPIPGQEARNRDYLLERGAAVFVKHAGILAHRVRELLLDDSQRTAMRARALQIARPRAAEDIAREALRLLGRGIAAAEPPTSFEATL